MFKRGIPGVHFTVRYRLGRDDPTWRYARTSQPQLRINLPEYKNGNELFVQVQAEQGGQIIEDWGQELIVTINKKVTIGDMEIDDDELVPPLDFTAHVLSPSSVKLEWRPHVGASPDLFYIVNVKQLTSDSGTALHRQQIKTSANSFTLGKLIAGEKYEMTIRSALSPTRISSTAAIVEIHMPREADYFEIGNLIISSHFQSNGRGIVNLTWEVPPNMENQVVSYDVQYVESGSGSWQKVVFHGTKPTAVLHNLKSDTEYILRIKTTLANNIQTESGEFKFKTPKVEANPIQKVDVIYSHEVNSVKLQWILEPHVRTDQIAGYDVYVSDDKDRPDSQWRLIRLSNREAALALDNLRSSTEYFVRVNIRNKDGSVIRAPSIYRFKTIDLQLVKIFVATAVCMQMSSPFLKLSRIDGSSKTVQFWNMYKIRRTNEKIHNLGGF
ncbi:fibronectin type III domain protein [Necator americanus]|uniref:Fibronectin type III domain protein n=1 Tax=Necator americanus TaxID=51031 RepID=W2SKV6_NECAM|nr:fibronectin type III domain protein [Necator americanus]ETN69362.1 fibronectin type III domain protein [Necator americanus]